MSITNDPRYPFTDTLDAISGLLTAAKKEHLLKPRVGVVCGSGLSTLASQLRDKHEIPYSALPGFGKSTGLLPLYDCNKVQILKRTDGFSPGTQEHSSIWPSWTGLRGPRGGHAWKSKFADLLAFVAQETDIFCSSIPMRDTICQRLRIPYVLWQRWEHSLSSVREPPYTPHSAQSLTG
jgi:hypothetical protein